RREGGRRGQELSRRRSRGAGGRGRHRPRPARGHRHPPALRRAVDQQAAHPQLHRRHRRSGVGLMHPLARAQVAQTARRIHAAGWAANHDGNVSVRIGRDRFLITPTATSKAEVTESMLVVVDGAGKLVEGTLKPPGETELHLAAYRARPDVDAVLHAHPPYATAFGAARAPLEPICLPEAVVSLGYVPLAPCAMPKTPLATGSVSRCAAEA